MESYILQENVLTDNVLLLAEDGKLFKGGYKAIVKEFVYQSAWTDREIVKKFRSAIQLDKYLTKKYPKFNYYR
jgi:hypothetical protein